MALLLAAACEGVEPAPPASLPELALIAPSDGERVFFDTPFTVSAAVVAPKDGTVSGVELVMRGAIDDRRRIEASGSFVDLGVEITVPGDGRLGRDLVPLELVLTPEAQAGGEVRVGAPRSVVVAVLDRTDPVLEVSFVRSLPPPPGFDAAFPAGAPFVVSLRATDPVGGIVRLAIDAPRALGGPRERSLSPAHEASFDVVFAPPANADLEIEAIAEDAAATPNRAARTLRIRIGEGGTDVAPPELALVDAAPIECGAPVEISVRATDDASGIDRITLRGAAFSATAYGPSADDPLQLTVTATAPAIAPAGARLAFEAEAEDVFGNAASAPFSLEVVDTQPPLLSLARVSGAFAPGEPFDLMLMGEEACGVIERVRVDFGASDATAAVGAPVFAGVIAVDAPPAICVLEPIRAQVTLIDGAGLASNAVSLELVGRDTRGPEIRIDAPIALAPGAMLDAQIEIDDGQSPVRSATVTLAPIGLALPDPIAAAADAWAVASCADRVPRTLPLAFALPEDLTFLAAPAALRIRVVAEDAAGNASIAVADVPVIDGSPPLLRVVEPPEGSVLVPGTTVPLVVEVSDPNGDVVSLLASVGGSLSIDAPGATTATRAVGAASATVTFALLLDPAPPLLGAAVAIGLSAVDSGARTTTASLSLTMCGPPSVLAIEPAIGPLGGGTEVTIRGAAFAPTATVRIGGELLESLTVESASVARGRIPLGPHAPGFADVSLTNDCVIASPGSTLPLAFEFSAAARSRYAR